MTGILFSVSYSTSNPIDIVQIKFMNAYEVFIAMNFDLNIFFILRMVKNMDWFCIRSM